MTDAQETVYRYRLTFSKEKPVKYVGHLDTVTAWTRAFRRVQLPLAYTHGFNPQARIQVASSLPLGFMGSAEIMDIYLTQELPPSDVVDRVRPTLPRGFSLHEAKPVPTKGPSLQSQLTEAEYRAVVETPLSADEIRQRINDILAEERVLITRIRKRREEKLDIRPLIQELALVAYEAGNENDDENENGDATIEMRLSAGSQGNLKATDMLKALALQESWSEVTRTRLHFLAG